MGKTRKDATNSEDGIDIEKWDIRDKIYEIRGQQVMLDYDLAKYYGYETRYLNLQVKRNSAKFDNDFMFKLDKEETARIMQSNLTLQNATSKRGGNRNNPYAFTESGIYMLMTVLKGEKATEHSKALIRMFRAMKDYVINSQRMIGSQNDLQLAMKVSDNAKEIALTKNRLEDISTDINTVKERLDTFVKKSEISPFLQNFGRNTERGEYLIREGELTKASEAYINICSSARSALETIDDYVDIKTLRYLQKVKTGVNVTIYTDNLGHYLHARDFMDFGKEFSWIKVRLVKTRREFHDRFIIIDRKGKSTKIYHCGSSLKDSGRKLTVIDEIKDVEIIKGICERVKKMSHNTKLAL